MTKRELDVKKNRTFQAIQSPKEFTKIRGKQF